MKSMLILLVVTICFGKAKSQTLSDAINMCSGSFDQLVDCSWNAIDAQTYDGKEMEVHLYDDLIKCYNQSGCKAPALRYGGSNTTKLFGCQEGVAGALDIKMNECTAQALGPLSTNISQSDQETLAGILYNVVWRAKAISSVLGGWAAFQRPQLQDSRTVGAACNTTAKQDKLNNCTRDAYDRAQKYFDNYCIANAACYQGLGQCSALYDILQMAICGCQDVVYSRVRAISNQVPSCLALPQYMVDIIPRQYHWCDTIPLNWCQSFGAWSTNGV